MWAYDQLGLIPDVFSRLGIQMERRGGRPVHTGAGTLRDTDLY